MGRRPPCTPTRSPRHAAVVALAEISLDEPAAERISHVFPHKSRVLGRAGGSGRLRKVAPPHVTPPPPEDDPPPPKRIGSHARASQPPERWSRLLRPRAHLAACSKVRGGVGRGWGGRGGKYETMGVVANRKEYGSGERERVERKSREREKERESRE